MRRDRRAIVSVTFVDFRLFLQNADQGRGWIDIFEVEKQTDRQLNRAE